jgi:hypothetical protein
LNERNVVTKRTIIGRFHMAGGVLEAVMKFKRVVLKMLAIMSMAKLRE